MQKHEEWLDNKNYEQHMRCLQSIRTRSRVKYVKSAVPNRSGKRHLPCNKESELDRTTEFSQSHRNTNNFQDTETKDPENRKSQRSREQNDKMLSKGTATLLTVKERDLLWDNYLLGKRILETSSVISMRKNEADYKKYKKILDARTQRTKKQKINDQFRSSKLHEYNLATHRVAQCGRLPSSAASRQIICLKLKDLRFYKQRVSGFQDVLFKFCAINPNDHSKRFCVQDSQIVNILKLKDHCFFFKLPPHHFKRIRAKENSEKNADLVFTICEVKGLNELPIGSFTISESQVINQPSHCVLRLEKQGRLLGEVEVQFQCVSKRMLVRNFE